MTAKTSLTEARRDAARLFTLGAIWALILAPAGALAVLLSDLDDFDRLKLSDDGQRLMLSAR